MHCIESLVAGIRGAEHGAAKIYARGTTTRVSVYSDFEGTSVDSSGANIVLDGNGSARVYVNQTVDVTVYDADGVELFTFTSATAAGNVEYQGQGFRGRNYETNALGAGSGYPTRLQDILDLAKTSFGSTDWRVLVNGTPTNLDDAIGGMLGVFYNVKAYGAVGDGVANDAAGIQAAITAASDAGGGIVFFPKGSYLFGTTITVPNTVSLLGCGAKSVVLGYSANTSHALSFSTTGTSYPPLLVQGITIAAAHTNSDACVGIVSGARVRFVLCSFIQTGTTGRCAFIDTTTSSRCVFNDCQFTVATTSTANMVHSNSGGSLDFRDCYFVTPVSYSPTNAIVYGNALSMSGCHFVSTASTTGTIVCVAFNSTTVVGQIDGCAFTNGGGATVTAIALGTYTANSFFSEGGNIFGATITAYSYTFAAAATGAKVSLRTRETRHLEVSSDASPLSIAVSQYGSITVRRSTNAVQSYTVDGVPPEGATGTLVVITSGTPGDLTLSTGFEGVKSAHLTATGLALNTDPSITYRSMLARGGNVRCKLLGSWAYTV